MPRKTFAEVSRAVTKKITVKSELKKRVSSPHLSKLKKKETSKGSTGSETPRLEDVEDSNAPASAKERENKVSEKSPETETGDNSISLTGEGDPGLPEEGQNDAEVVVLGEEPPAEDVEEDEEEEEKKQEEEMGRKVGRVKKLSKKQLRLQEERLEEEREREERRKRREERKRKKELQAQLALEEATQSFDEAAYRESIYTMVKNSLGLVMNQGELNITVDNLNPVMNSLELDTGDEDIKDLILTALLDSYGLVAADQIDSLIMRKQLEKDLDDVEDCVDAAFAIIDQDRDGIITHNDVYRLMIHLGEVLWDNQVAAMFERADMDGDGRISKKDLFLFLLGREKTIKLEDQILNKYGNKEEADPPSTSAPPSTEKAPESAKTTAESAPSSTTTTTTPSLATTLKAAEPSEDAQAADRRRKMFSGYSKLVIASNRIADNGSDSLRVDTSESDKAVVTAVLESVGKLSSDVKSPETSGQETASKQSDLKRVEEVPKPPDNEDDKQTNKSGDGSQNDSGLCQDNDQGDEKPIPLINLACSDWSDSGHVGSDHDDDSYENDSEEELQFEGPPMALEAGISYLPAPEFDAVSSPATPQISVTFSPRPTSQLSVRNDEPSPETVDLDSTTTHKQDTDALGCPDLDLDALTSARTERTSEYDSEREGDEDSLPETSQQRAILKEIERQVWHTKEALKAKGPSLAGVRLKNKYAAMLTNDKDGCESVVESEIHPVYVPPCARDAPRGHRISSLFRGTEAYRSENLGTTDDADDLAPKRHRLAPDKENQDNGDLLTVEDHTNSTLEILSKDYVSFTSPRSTSPVMTKLPLSDLNDDVFSPSADVQTPVYVPSVSDKPGFEVYLSEKSLQYSDRFVRERLATAQEGQVERLEMDFSGSGVYRDLLVDGAPSNMRPTCDRAQKETARKRASRAPLRRSFTCHTVTVKDLSALLHRSTSPPRRTPSTTMLIRRQSSVGPSIYRSRNDSPCSRKDSPHSFRETPFSRKQPYLKRESSIGSSESDARRKLFDPRRARSQSRMDSPCGWNASSVSRVYSPAGRTDTDRSQGMDSHRANMESSRSQKYSSRSYRESSRWESLHSQRESSRSQKESFRSQLDSCRSRKNSSRVKSDTILTFRSGGRTDRSFDEEVEDNENKEDDFRFLGPNFDIIMSQKGEPEEFLHESLRRDGFLPSSARRRLSKDVINLKNRTDSSPAPAESRKARISQQLERVKEMENLIRQRRENTGLDPNEDVNITAADSRPKSAITHHRDRRHTMHRSKTFAHITSPHSTQSTQPNTNKSNVNTDGTPGQKVRPRSCMAGRRTISSSTPKVVTIADEKQVHMSSRHSSISKNTDQVETTKDTHTEPDYLPEPIMHVVDLSSLLTHVNDPEPCTSTHNPGNETDRSRGATFKPLARVLVTYENARRRQAATAIGSSDSNDPALKSSATSISRQLQQGIPYRAATTTSFSRHHNQGDVSTAPTPRKTTWDLDSHRSNNSTKSSGAEHNPNTRYQQKRGSQSFVLSANCHNDSQDQPALTDLTSIGKRHARSDVSMTFEFPERSVCVLKPKPVTAVLPDTS